MPPDRRGALLPELLIALTVLTLGLAPSAWVFARAERLVAEARARERAALAAEGLLARLEGGLACVRTGGVEDAPGVTVRWLATTDSLRRVQAIVQAGPARADTLVTAAWCP